MLVTSRHFLKPKDLSCIEMMLLRGDTMSCDCFFNSRNNDFWISLKFNLCRSASPSRIF